VDREENRLKAALLREKPAEMLVFLGKGTEPKYVTQVSKATDCTYSHVIKILDMFRELGLLEFQKIGRMKIVKLTPDGSDVAHDLDGVITKIKRISDKTVKKKQGKKGEKEKKPAKAPVPVPSS